MKANDNGCCCSSGADQVQPAFAANALRILDVIGIMCHYTASNCFAVRVTLPCGAACTACVPRNDGFAANVGALTSAECCPCVLCNCPTGCSSRGTPLIQQQQSLNAKPPSPAGIHPPAPWQHLPWKGSSSHSSCSCSHCCCCQRCSCSCARSAARLQARSCTAWA